MRYKKVNPQFDSIHAIEETHTHTTNYMLDYHRTLSGTQVNSKNANKAKTTPLIGSQQVNRKPWKTHVEHIKLIMYKGSLTSDMISASEQAEQLRLKLCKKRTRPDFQGAVRSATRLTSESGVGRSRAPGCPRRVACPKARHRPPERADGCLCRLHVSSHTGDLVSHSPWSFFRYHRGFDVLSRAMVLNMALSCIVTNG